MIVHRTRGGPRPLAVLGIAYGALIAVAILDWAAWHIHVGVIAVIPLLFIAYYARLPVALATAACSGFLFAFLDRDEISEGSVIGVSPMMDALALSAALCAVVFVAERLQKAHTEAARDSLTGIPNRSYFLGRLSACVRARAAQEHVGVLFADLDGFKNVNDSAGHNVGDRVLVLAAERLRHAIRANDLLARIGGDEFAILIDHLPDQAEADALAHKVQGQFENPFTVGDAVFKLGVTVGVSIAPQDGLDPESLLRTADARMYGRKKAKCSPRVTIGTT